MKHKLLLVLQYRKETRYQKVKKNKYLYRKENMKQSIILKLPKHLVYKGTPKIKLTFFLSNIDVHCLYENISGILFSEKQKGFIFIMVRIFFIFIISNSNKV